MRKFKKKKLFKVNKILFINIIKLKKFDYLLISTYHAFGASQIFTSPICV